MSTKNVVHLDRWLPAGDAAEALGVKPATLRQWVRRGRIERRRDGGRSLYRVSVTKRDSVTANDFASRDSVTAERDTPSNGHHEPLAQPAPASASPADTPAHAARTNLADQVERLARMVGRLEVELEQSRAELAAAQTHAPASADVDLEAIRSEVAALIAQRNAAEHHAQAAERKAEAYGRRSGAIVRFVRARFGRDVADEVLAAGRED